MSKRRRRKPGGMKNNTAGYDMDSRMDELTEGSFLNEGGPIPVDDAISEDFPEDDTEDASVLEGEEDSSSGYSDDISGDEDSADSPAWKAAEDTGELASSEEDDEHSGEEDDSGMDTEEYSSVSDSRDDSVMDAEEYSSVSDSPDDSVMDAEEYSSVSDFPDDSVMDAEEYSSVSDSRDDSVMDVEEYSSVSDSRGDSVMDTDEYSSVSDSLDDSVMDAEEYSSVSDSRDDSVMDAEEYSSVSDSQDDSAAEASDASPVSDTEDSSVMDTDDESSSAEDTDTGEDYSTWEADDKSEDAGGEEKKSTAASGDSPLDRAYNKLKSLPKTTSSILILCSVVFICLLAVFGLYSHEKSKPIAVAEAFLASIQDLDFDRMEQLVKNNDLSSLDRADVRSTSYRDFYQMVNSRMTYDIRRTDFHFSSGTAEVIAHIRYIDGTSIYQNVVSDFMRTIVDSAFSGVALNEEDTSDTLAEMLMARKDQLDGCFAETQVRYPLEKIENEWKITSLDEQTIRIITANFYSIEDEIRKSIGQSEESEAEEDTSTTAENTQEETPLAESGEDIIVMGDAVSDAASNPLVNIDTAQALSIDTADFSIRYNKYALGKDYAGSDCLLYYFTYTNRSSEPSSPMKDIRLKAFQNGKSLSDAIPNGKDAALDNFYAQVNPQETITVCRAFSLADRSNVTMQADVSGNDGPTVSTHMLKLE